MGKWVDGNWYSNDSYKQYNDYKYYGNQKVYNDKKVDDKVVGLYVDPAYTLEDNWIEDEWTMYEYICDVYGLDLESEATFEYIEYYMELNKVDNITDLYRTLTDL
jgi:hypothetical protein